MKHIIAAIIILAAAAGLRANNVDAARSAVIELADGSTLRININKGLTMTFADGNAVMTGINAQGEPVSVTAPLADFKSWTLSDTTGPELTGIDGPAADGVGPAVDGMVVTGARPGSVITVIDTAGRTVATVTAGTDGTAPLPFASLAKGVYIVVTPSGSCKVAL